MNFKKENKKNKIMICQIALIIIAMICGFIVWKQTRVEELPKKPGIVKYKDNIKEKGTTVENPIDFDAYWQINADVYAYIYLADSEIDYPILQHAEQDDYYLNHTIDNMEVYPGSIYTEKINAKDFNDPNTIIYGHNMVANKTMFNAITRYSDSAYLKSHHVFYIYTPSQILQYEVFAAYETDNAHLMYQYQYDDASSFQQFLNDVKNKDNVVLNDNIDVTTKDTIVTMSTCSESGVDNRYVVHAVLKNKIDCTYKHSTKVDKDLGTFENMKKADIVE